MVSKFLKILTPSPSSNKLRYENDQGYNDEFNPFAHVSQEYVDKREKQLEKTRQKPRLTLKQQQIKKENEMWENNRLARSGLPILQQIQI